MAKAKHTISSQIRHIIEARGFTPTEVADLADVDRAGISRFLAGKRGLTLATADKIAAAFHLRLIEGEAPKAPGPAAGEAQLNCRRPSASGWSSAPGPRDGDDHQSKWPRVDRAADTCVVAARRRLHPSAR